MNTQFVVAELEKEWKQPEGFFGRLRTGVFELTGFEKVVKILESVQLEDTATLDRRFVSLTWYIPTFMDWQRERLQERGGSVQELEIAINKIQGLLERVLGIP